MKKIRVLDLYCGMGGLSLGFALALRAEILGLDIDKWAVETYNLNLSHFGCRAIVQDVLRWKPTSEFDLVIGGSPCQPFSIANTTIRGENHPLFPTFIRFYDVVLALKPKAFVMENVKGLITNTFVHYLTQQLSRVKDYYVKYSVLNAADYGVPQRRERLFVVGIRKDIGVSFEFPKPTHAHEEYVDLSGNRVKRWVTLKEAIGDIMHIPPAKRKTLHRKQEEKNFDKTVLFMNSNREIVEIPWTKYQDKHLPLNLDEPSYTLLSHIAKSSRVALLPMSDHVMTDLDPSKVWNSEWGTRVMCTDSPANTITEKHRSGQLLPVVYRRLTVRECLRIQSFPDWWIFPDRCSVSKRYKLVGEAVPPILAYHLATAIGKALGLEVKSVTKDEFFLPYFDRVF
jgi:DNA (cytosine-5)-methyltransferase 1